MITSFLQLRMVLAMDRLHVSQQKLSQHVFKEHHHESLDELLSRCNEYMVQKRGAAVAIVKIDYKQKDIQYSCVGNVRFYMLHGGENDLSSSGYGLFIWEAPKVENTRI